MKLDRDRLENDPDFAPYLNRAGKYFFWRPPARYVGMGYPSKAIRLPGEDGDLRHRERAQKCRDLTLAMIRQFETDNGYPPGTWGWAICAWKDDPLGNYRNARENTRADYDYRSKKWLAILGDARIEDTTYQAVAKILHTMRERGYSAGTQAKLMIFLRMVAKYAYGPLRHRPAGQAMADLANIRTRTNPPRDKHPTPEHVRAIIDEADRRGMSDFAAGILIQWTYGLRAVDVRGQWFDQINPDGGIIRRRVVKGETKYAVWQDGLTWDMFDPGMTAFRKVVSKTRRSMPEAMEFRLMSEVRSRLMLLRNKGGVGPVILSGDGLPYTVSGWSQAWSRLREAAGVPKDIWMMDTRSGAINDAIAHGADPFAARDFAGHRNVATTDRYVRGRNKRAAEVVDLRSKSRR